MSIWNTKIKDLGNLGSSQPKQKKKPIFKDEVAIKTPWEKFLGIAPYILLVAIIFLGLIAFLGFGKNEPAHTPIREPVVAPVQEAAHPSGYQPQYSTGQAVSGSLTEAIGGIGSWISLIVLLIVVGFIMGIFLQFAKIFR